MGGEWDLCGRDDVQIFESLLLPMFVILGKRKGGVSKSGLYLSCRIQKMPQLSTGIRATSQTFKSA